MMSLLIIFSLSLQELDFLAAITRYYKEMGNNFLLLLYLSR